MNSFAKQHPGNMTGIPSCIDHLITKGYLGFSYRSSMADFARKTAKYPGAHRYRVMPNAFALRSSGAFLLHKDFPADTGAGCTEQRN